MLLRNVEILAISRAFLIIFEKTHNCPQNIPFCYLQKYAILTIPQAMSVVGISISQSEQYQGYNNDSHSVYYFYDNPLSLFYLYFCLKKNEITYIKSNLRISQF